MNGDLADVFGADGFNPNDPKYKSDCLPAGEYGAMIVKAEVKTTQAGTGKYIDCRMVVIDGEFINRSFFQKFNIQNPNATAEQIGKGQLSKLCKAIGIVGNPKSTDELLNKPFIARVKCALNKLTDEMQNECTTFKVRPRGGMISQSPVASAPQVSPQPAVGNPFA
jgi:hypothetical protein